MIAAGASAKVSASETCIQLLSHMSDRLKYLQPSMTSLLQSLCGIKSFEKLAFLQRCRGYMTQGMSFPESWHKAVLESREYIGVEEAEIVAGLCEVLGCTDLDSQLSGISYAKELLCTKLEEARERRDKYAKLYRSIGALAGIAVAIILI